MRLILSALAITILLTTSAIADGTRIVSLPWSTSFDCNEWTRDESDPDYSNPIVCADDSDAFIEGQGNGHPCGGTTYYTQITTDANNPLGSGRGQRTWIGNVGTGSNEGTSGVYLYPPRDASEIYIRWYMRYANPGQAVWDTLHYDKIMYFEMWPNTSSDVVLEWMGSDNLRVATQDMGFAFVDSGVGWNTMMNAANLYSDGDWHYIEVHLKLDTDGTDGIVEIWIDNDTTPVYSNTSANLGAGGAGVTGFNEMIIYSNQEYVASGVCGVSVDIDDVAISSSGQIGALDSGGPSDPNTGLIKGSQLFSESFENDSWSSRTWYDGTNSTGTEAGGYSGNALKWEWAQSATQPTGFSAIRSPLAQATDEFLIEYYVKYDTGWQGSGQAYHPHLMHILSSDDTAYQGFAASNSNLYFESIVTGGINHPVFAHQDLVRAVSAENDLTGVTETRSANNCDTPYALTGADVGSCYSSGGWYSANLWNPQAVAIPGDEWVKITAYVKMNTFTDGVGNFDGIVKMWVNSDLAIESNTVLYAAGAYEGSMWDKIALAPWIGDGSPIAQSMWMDELSVWAIDSGGQGYTNASCQGGTVAASGGAASVIMQ